MQGTDADLRRMTTQQAKERLMQFGLPEEEINSLGRWVGGSAPPRPPCSLLWGVPPPLMRWWLHLGPLEGSLSH